MLKKALRNPLLLQSLVSIIARFVGVALNFAVAKIITTELPRAEAGMLFLLMTFVTGFALFSRIGIDQLLIKEVASAKENDDAFKHGFLRSSYRFIAIFSLGFMTFWLILSPLLQKHFFDNQINLNYLMLASVGILFYNVVVINSTYLKAIKQTVKAVLSQNALPAITLLVLLAFFWSSFREQQAFINIYTFSLFLAGVIAITMTRSAVFSTSASALSNPKNSQGLKSLIKKSLPLAPISFISFLMIFADKIMVGLYLTNADVALYEIAGRVSFIVLFFLGALEATIYPRLLNVSTQNPAHLRSFFWQSTALVIAIVFSITLAMYFLSDLILGFFGNTQNDYTFASESLQILLFAQLLRAISLTFSFMFIIREKVRYLNIILGLALATNLICNAFLIPQYGINGAALATLFANAFLLVAVLSLFFFHKLLQRTNQSQGAESA
ncbi:MAG: polysaccharide biosynthesis C-terminal domain-containing protein [Cocleimonas sp.]